MLHDKITDGRKRRADNHPAMDLSSVDGPQLFVDGHPEINHTPNPTWACCKSMFSLYLAVARLDLVRDREARGRSTSDDSSCA